MKEKKILSIERPDLLKEWDYEKNALICSPNAIGVNSHTKVWWKCPKGHSYEATIHHRNQGTACPFCANKRVLKGFNDLATLRPDIIKEWDYEKNDITPDEVLSGSNRKVWWKCPHDHSYDMPVSIKSRIGCKCPICNGKRVLKGYNDFASAHPELLREWNYEKNKISPDNVTEMSHKKVWWKCSDCGNEWEAPVARRSGGSGCPVCSIDIRTNKRKTASADESIAVLYPNLLSEWNYEKNTQRPESVYPASNTAVWWKCEKGHEWKATVSNRTGKNPTSCPFCANKKTLEGFNDLQTLYPEIAKEWDYSKNQLLPKDVVGGSNKKVWWICPKGHSYKEIIAARTSGKSNCPYCSGHRVLIGFNDLATVRPEIIKDWDYEKNKTITPFEVTEHSNKKVWWKCSKCGYEWQSTITTKTRSDSVCGVCSNRVVVTGMNDLATQHPELLSEWSSKNTIDPRRITSGSGKRVWWECSKCGCEWRSDVYNRVYNGSGCPDCAQRLQTSMPEQVIFQYIRKYYPNAVNRYKTDWLKHSEIDVFIPDINCGIEYDGARWHSDAKKDEKKSSLIKKHGIDLIRVREEKCPTLNNDDIVIKVEKYDQNIDSLKPVLRSVFATLNDKYRTNIKFNSNNDWDVFARDFVFDPIGVSLAEGNPELIKEWDYEKNGKLKPENVSLNSTRKVWWKCSKCGYSYSSQIHSRSAGTGCPACANKKVYRGYNDLATLYPDIAKEWDYSKNEKTPAEVVAHSSKKVWWKCTECGYEWETRIAERTSKRGTGCPACARQVVLKGKNDLEALYPVIAREWDFKKNSTLPCDHLAFSGRRVWWICPKGHSYDMSIQSRTCKKSNCPICAKKRVLIGFSDLKTLYPEIAKEWDYEKNGEVTPEKVFPKTNKRYWWICQQGHSYEASPNNRTSKNRGCPYCSGHRVMKGFNDLTKTNPELLEYWDYDKNTIAPEDVSSGSHKKVWWKCPECGYEWLAAPHKIVSETRCPVCMTRKTKHSKEVFCAETQHTFDSIQEAANSMGISTSSLSAHLNGRTKSCGGYHWVLVDKEKE